MASKNDDMHPEHKRISDAFLLAAVRSHEYDRIKLCMKKGADINACDNDGHTPLMLAVIRGSPALVSSVLAHNPDLFAKSKSGKTAYDFISSLGFGDTRNKVTDLMLNALPDAVRAEVEKPEDVAKFADSSQPAPKPAITAPRTASFGQKENNKDAQGKKGFTL